ncbi:MAG: hypothetical protein KDC91_03105 [Flavobacteriaceae bacterium]|nr:hypothetical protein [Flavobacteriaceae bacterium]
MKLKIKCNESNHICDKSQYKEASLWEKIKLNIHLLYCDFCRKYTANNQRLTKTIKSTTIKTLCEEDKKVLKEKLLQEMKK